MAKSLRTYKTSAVYIFIFLYTVLNGVLRKWVFVNNTPVGNVLFLIQLLSPYLFIVLDTEGSKKIFNSRWISAFFILLIIESFNPLQLTFFHGIIGFLLHFSFWFAAFYYIENRDKVQLYQIIDILVIVGIGEIVLAFIQYPLPKGNFLNRYAEEKNVGNIISEVGTAVRVTGTFSYISGFSSYLLFHAYYVWALIKLQYRPYVTLSLMIGGLIACFMNGSRGATYVYEIIMLFFLIFEARRSNIGSFIVRLIVPLVIAILVILARGQLGIESNISTAYDNYSQRQESGIQSGEQSARVFHDWYVITDFKGKYPLFGVGLGSTYQGNNLLFGTSDYVTEYGFIESELERYILEGGFVLLIFRLILTIYFCKRLYIPFLAKFLVGGLLFMTPIVFNIYNSIFSFIGITLLDQVYYLNRNNTSFNLSYRRLFA